VLFVDEDNAGGVARFANDVVDRCGPLEDQRRKALLFAVGKLGAYCSAIGLELDAELCLSSEVIERFIVVSDQTLSGPTRRTLRTNLRFVARRVLVSAPGPVALSRERSKEPYLPAEIAAFLSSADAQPTPARRHRLSALVCLGAGAGLIGAELRAVRGTDIVSRSGGVVVVVTTRRPRVVPLLADFGDRLGSDAAFLGDALMIGGVDEARRNVTGRLVASVAGGLDLSRLDVGRLRATWLTEVAKIIGLRAFLDAAGVTTTQRLGDLVARIEPPQEAEAVRILGARK